MGWRAGERKKVERGNVKERDERKKTADQEREWGSTDIPPTQTHSVLISGIFLALWSTVVGRTVSALMVCMTPYGLRGGFLLPWCKPLPSLFGDPCLYSIYKLYLLGGVFCPIWLYFFSFFLLKASLKRINLDPFVLLAPTAQLASIVCN